MMNPYLSWAILLVVAGGLGWYYNGPTPKVKNPVRTAVVEKTEPAVSAKKPKRKTAKKERSPEPASIPVSNKADEKKPVVDSKPQEADQIDGEIDNKEMAERFAAVKSGTVPASSGASKSQKKKKNKKAAPAGQLESSSTTGAEADDDMSSTGSPVVNPVPTAGYVSDMLEEPAPGASVLRVTGSVESQQPKKQKPQSFKQVETKKQRQQRMKNEVRKEQVQAAEQERRKLLEKQLHTARESERREAAKAKPAAAPTSNAWQSNPNGANVTNGAPKTAAPAAKVELLDTFDHEASSAKSSEPAVNGGSNKWSQELPSEEEQMRMLSASNGATDEWTTVSTKAKKPKKGGKADESVSEASASENNQASTTPSAPAPVEPKVTVTPTYIPDILRSKQKGHPLDSDWAA